MLEKMADEIGGCVYSDRFCPAGLLPTSYPLPRMNGRHLRRRDGSGRKMETIGGTGGRNETLLRVLCYDCPP